MSVTIVLYFTKDLLSSSKQPPCLMNLQFGLLLWPHFTGIHKPQTLGGTWGCPQGVHFNLGKGLHAIQTTRKPVQTVRLG